MKKIIIGLGSLAAIGAPIAAVISCGNDTGKVTKITKLDLTTDAGKASTKTWVLAHYDTTTHGFKDFTEISVKFTDGSATKEVKLLLADLATPAASGALTGDKKLAYEAIIKLMTTPPAPVVVKELDLTTEAGKTAAMTWVLSHYDPTTHGFKDFTEITIKFTDGSATKAVLLLLADLATPTASKALTGDKKLAYEALMKEFKPPVVAKEYVIDTTQLSGGGIIHTWLQQANIFKPGDKIKYDDFEVTLTAQQISTFKTGNAVDDVVNMLKALLTGVDMDATNTAKVNTLIDAFSTALSANGSAHSSLVGNKFNDLKGELGVIPTGYKNMNGFGMNEWHELFHANKGRSLPADDTKFAIIVSDKLFTYTWVAADTSATVPAAYVAASIGDQTKILTYLAIKLTGYDKTDDSGRANLDLVFAEIVKKVTYHNVTALDPAQIKTP